MGARHKLNSAYINGALIIAGLFGLLLENWTVFMIVVIIQIASSVYLGDIRPNSNRK